MAKDKKKKPLRPKALPPKGFRDYFGTDVAERNAMLSQITEVYHRYGFDALESPAVETVEALGKFLPDVDRPNAGVFAWQDEDDAWMALRYDHHWHGFMRNSAMNYPTPIAALRWAPSGAMKNRGRGVIVNSISAMQIPLVRPVWLPTPRFA